MRFALLPRPAFNPRASARHRSSPAHIFDLNKSPGAHGPSIVGTHGLCVTPSTKIVSMAARLGIARANGGPPNSPGYVANSITTPCKAQQCCVVALCRSVRTESAKFDMSRLRHVVSQLPRAIAQGRRDDLAQIWKCHLHFSSEHWLILNPLHHPQPARACRRPASQRSPAVGAP